MPDGRIIIGDGPAPGAKEVKKVPLTTGNSSTRWDVAAANPTGRIGDPAEFGALCAVLCSAHAGYINGQNLLMDGGAFAGLF